MDHDLPIAGNSAPEPYPYVPQPALFPLSKADSDQRSHRLQVWLAGRGWLAGLALTALAACASVVPLMEVIRQNEAGAVFVYMCFGIICGAGANLSTWLVWGEGRFRRRLLVCWGAGAVLILGWVVGYGAVNRWRPDWDGLVTGLFTLPLVSLAIQLPLWGTRVGLGWRLVHRNAITDAAAQPVSNPAPPDHQLTTRDLMLATIVVAVSFAAARLVRTSRPEEYWLVWGIAIASVAGASLVGIPPVAVLLLRMSVRWGLILVVSYALVVCVVTIAALVLASQGRIPARDAFGIAVVIGSLGATLAWGALALRQLGYELVTARSR